jgi:hypothetical protein
MGIHENNVINRLRMLNEFLLQGLFTGIRPMGPGDAHRTRQRRLVIFDRLQNTGTPKMESVRPTAFRSVCPVFIAVPL